MKVVRLNRRYKMFKDHGHVIGLRFPGWDKDASNMERLCNAKLGSKWGQYPTWSGHFGSPNYTDGSGRKTYWITFRDELDLTLILLAQSGAQ